MAYTTINKSTSFFNNILYTGNGSTQSITGVGFQPDFVWLKDKSNANAHRLNDSVRGATKFLASNNSDAETTQSAGLTAFDSDGFSLGSNSDYNGNSANFASWNWKAGTTSGLSGGTITPSAYSINTTSGFGIYKYTGNGYAGANIAHGLGKVPKMIIVKRTDSTPNWQIYHEGMGNGKWLEFTTGAAQTATNRWNDTSPTSTLFYLGTDSDVNSSSGTYIAYVFCDVTGFSKMGSYEGNGNTNGTFIYTGFRPEFIMVKRWSGGTNNWLILDSKRPAYNLTQNGLLPNSNAAENNGYNCDFVNNGFKWRLSGSGENGTNYGYVYAAFGQSLVGSNNVVANAR